MCYLQYVLKYKISMKLSVLNLREQEAFAYCVRRIAIEFLLPRADMDNDNRSTVFCLCNDKIMCV